MFPPLSGLASLFLSTAKHLEKGYVHFFTSNSLSALSCFRHSAGTAGTKLSNPLLLALFLHNLSTLDHLIPSLQDCSLLASMPSTLLVFLAQLSPPQRSLS